MMSTYKALTIMIAFATLVVLIITANEKSNHPASANVRVWLLFSHITLHMSHRTSCGVAA
ncbi:putative holin-like toxin [Alkalihalobacillus sp. TS-13]|uniref:putative holin-like toxin n=1 Tax=Alkalihalobacillus sp. TS-13 TaxID=2842455 RepID=UPI001C870DA9|nr:putative holin-like toxin [Alkalihalobacillus sp. TS-13]